MISSSLLTPFCGQTIERKVTQVEAQQRCAQHIGVVLLTSIADRLQQRLAFASR